MAGARAKGCIYLVKFWFFWKKDNRKCENNERVKIRVIRWKMTIFHFLPGENIWYYASFNLGTRIQGSNFHVHKGEVTGPNIRLFQNGLIFIKLIRPPKERLFLPLIMYGHISPKRSTFFLWLRSKKSHFNLKFAKN